MDVLRTHDRLLSGLDHARLSTLLFKPRVAVNLSPGLAEVARDMLDAARVVDAAVIDQDVVTMRSIVAIEQPGVGESSISLVYPHESDPHAGCISVFTPMGLALLGARRGQQVKWLGPEQREQIATVLRMVYQPEAAGDHRR
jgi:regulator of nucleoside diphosphate kinase